MATSGGKDRTQREIRKSTAFLGQPENSAPGQTEESLTAVLPYSVLSLKRFPFKFFRFYDSKFNLLSLVNIGLVWRYVSFVGY